VSLSKFSSLIQPDTSQQSRRDETASNLIFHHVQRKGMSICCYPPSKRTAIFSPSHQENASDTGIIHRKKLPNDQFSCEVCTSSPSASQRSFPPSTDRVKTEGRWLFSERYSAEVLGTLPQRNGFNGFISTYILL